MTNPVPDRPDEHDEPESEWVECPSCEGNGLIWDESYRDFVTCPKCSGIGEVLNPNLSDHEQAMALYNRNRY